jgi:crossover junction endodeoxyribonuclease RuvC
MQGAEDMNNEAVRICGVDNGLDGGVVVMNSVGLIIAKLVMPTFTLKGSKRDFDLQGLRAFLTQHGPIGRAFLERAQAMPGQGVSSMFKTGEGFGVNRGLLAGMQIPYTIVSPQTWQKVMFLGLPKEGKSTSRVVCSRIWPKEDFKASERCHVAHDGLCDAALIAEYGRLTMR